MIPAGFLGKPMVHLDHGPGKIHGYYTIEGVCGCSWCDPGDTHYVLRRYEPGVTGRPAMVGHVRLESFRALVTMEDELVCASSPCNTVHVTKREASEYERDRNHALTVR